MDKIVEELSKIGIIPVVVIEDTEKAVPLAKALCEGGLPAAEVTFRTAAAKDAIEAMCKACPEMIVGAGTVLTVKQAEDALRQEQSS
jgi:2-dehydro-3-deoxyphosphogluconate aldolase/(4S)-4-hydroxy-2-oxoglutarate aldolase